MRATHHALALALALALAPVACNRDKPAQPIKVTDAPPPAPPPLDHPALAIYPADAALIAHIDLSRLFASPLWQRNGALMADDPEAQRTLQGLAACGLALTDLYALDLAVDGAGSRVIVDLRGRGVGLAATLTCLGGQLFADRPQAWRLEEHRGAPRLVLDGGAAYAHPVADDRLIFAAAAWDAPLLERLAGRGAAPPQGPLGLALSALDTARPVWFAGRLPPGLGDSPGLQSVAGAFDLDDGLALEIDLVTATPIDAQELQRALQTRLAALRARLSGAAIPLAALDRALIEPRGAALHLRLHLTMDEINALRAALAEAALPPDPT
ncbi:MAG: hypothetical protein IPK80_24295 [Nannocystis sp.]|nr:hypothetical protein [Nannocystis sp.]